MDEAMKHRKDTEERTVDKNEMMLQCKKAAIDMRKDIIDMTYSVGSTGAHAGGAMSMVEILAVLYLAVMRYDAQDTRWEERDRFVLSKGHGVMALYAALKQKGVIRDLSTFKKNDSALCAHPSMNMDFGIECSSGSLGMGLSFGVGQALALKKKGNPAHVYVLVGDGECDEGSIWEAAMSGSHFNLDNLTVIVDKNQLQYDGPTEEILALGSLEKKWEAFGWKTYTVDGHSVEEVYDALTAKCCGPKAIIANTVKGKGVSFMENNAAWHNSSLSAQNYEKAMQEQEEAKHELFSHEY